MSAPRGARPGAGPRVAVVDNYDSFTYNLVHYVAEQGGRPTVFRNDAVGLADLAAFDLLLLSPGPGTPAEAGICVEAVRELGARLPILGVCLGHQSIATAFGGSVVRGEQVHGKASAVHHDGSGVLAGLPDPFTATRYHSLVVAPTGLPDELVVTARTADGTIMGLRHREHPVHGVQFHPESVLSPEGKQLIANFLECADD
ncbi:MULTISPECIES: aminodeoxychorismate/anthranilate synthase component II [Streptomyces]|uniref:anthranilate synthase component II n=1 Tax=Streptomyces TaxID=1883 RepID=UPI0002FE5FE5|nr:MULTISPECIES: aminodeoxychorismate/anthranilate synthase component II [Streptomyces]MBX4178127.1 aminodeoxychorismate/anthranilate synthase component II [Streptomyces geysiriensis]NUV97750.1 aminodeoxychorismate/anthranilate synthase component II [Streptomyces sp. KAI 90]QCB25347.1 aminodeoxychorismate/anthranilate synthase component II [Streptomyces sp. SS52]RSS02906.1 aminodeoxychorismate/anthranilate synthase component II [Streptomyces sp. WAC04189]RSS14071.1 aminodeoxychorismate/anthran